MKLTIAREVSDCRHEHTPYVAAMVEADAAIAIVRHHHFKARRKVQPAMPVLQIRGLPQSDPSRVQDAMKVTCAAIAKTYGCALDQVWATWETIEPGLYVEGNKTAEAQPANSHPPIARLICVEGKDPKAIEQLLTTAARTLSAALGMPGNIFMEYHEARSGQVIAGDGVVRRRSR